MYPVSSSNVTVAYLNVHGQSRMPISKQKQIEDLISRENIDILHLQEINVDENTFAQCNFIQSNSFSPE